MLQVEKIPNELFEDFHVRYIEKMIADGKAPQIIAGSISHFSDDVISKCPDCGGPMVMRPKIAAIVKTYNLKANCFTCKDPKEVTVATKQLKWIIRAELSKEQKKSQHQLSKRR